MPLYTQNYIAKVITYWEALSDLAPATSSDLSLQWLDQSEVSNTYNWPTRGPGLYMDCDSDHYVIWTLNLSILIIIWS